MTESQPEDAAESSSSGNARTFIFLAIILSVAYWWFFMGYGNLTDANLQRLKAGMPRFEVIAILGQDGLTSTPVGSSKLRFESDEWVTRRRSVVVKYYGGELLRSFTFKDR